MRPMIIIQRIPAPQDTLVTNSGLPLNPIGRSASVLQGVNQKEEGRATNAIS